MECVVDAILALLHFHFGSAADVDDGNAAAELGHALLQLLFVVVAGGTVVGSLNLTDASLDVLLLAGAFNHDGFVLVDDHLASATELRHLDRLERAARVVGEECASGEHRNVAEHGRTTIAKAWSLDGADLQHAAQLVDDESCKSLVLNFFSNDQQRLLGRGDLVEERQEVGKVADLLLKDQDVRILKNALGLLGVGHEVRRDVALVEGHAFNVIERGLVALGFFHFDHAIGADLVNGLGDEFAHRSVMIGADGGNLDKVALAGALASALGDGVASDFRCIIDATLHSDGVCTSSDVAKATVEDRSGEHGGGSGAVACNIGGLLGNLLHHACAHIGERLGELNFLSDGHAVLGDVGTAPALSDHHVATSGSHGDCDCSGDRVDALLELGLRGRGELHLLAISHCWEAFLMCLRCRKCCVRCRYRYCDVRLLKRRGRQAIRSRAR